MRRRRLVLVAAGLASALAATVVTTLTAQAAPGDADLAEVRAATAAYHRVAAAEEAGWALLPGLDHCFEEPGVGGMGFHYINTELFDDVADPRRPEALVYAPDRNGRLALAAVEWIIPADAWEGSAPPMVLGEHMHLNQALGVWVHHAWVFRHNPAGVFADWNPEVVCDR